MERFNALSRGAQIMLVASALLFIDTFLDWQHVEASFGGVTVAEGGVSGWHGVGIIMGILTVVLLAWLIVRLAAANINLPVSDALTGAVLGILILLFTIIKVLVDNEFRHWPAWVGLILAIIIAIGAWLSVQEAGGMDNLMSEAQSMGGGGGATAASTTPPPPAPPSAPPSAPPAAPPAPHDHSAEGHTHEDDNPA
jgi:hypothetical protein